MRSSPSLNFTGCLYHFLDVKFKSQYRIDYTPPSRGGEERRSEKSKSEKKEEAGVRKSRKVAIHWVFSNVLGLQRVER